VSESTLGRALEFMRKPQDVEVHRDGRWVLASMVGWRQEEGSTCRVMVRIHERGVEKTAWAELSDVRLPERGTFPRTESLPLLPRLPARTEQVTGRTSSVLEPADDAGPGTGRHHAARAPWWPSSEEGESPVADVEPTRLMTVPPPHYWRAVTSRHGGFAAY
jgi:hypothetical protein